MKTVSSRKEVYKNLFKLNDYLLSDSIKETDFAKDLLKKGWVFFALKVGKHFLFAPSRFVGYVENNMHAHENNGFKDGKETNSVLKVIFTQEQENYMLLAQFKTFLKKFGIDRNYNTEKTIRFFFDQENVNGKSACYFICPTHESGKKPYAWQNLLKREIAAIGWGHLDYSNYSWEDIRQDIKKNKYKNENAALEAHRSIFDMNPGDVVCITNNLHSLFGIGIVASKYRFKKAVHDTGAEDKTDWYSHYVDVSWIMPEVIKKNKLSISKDEKLWEPYGTVSKRSPVPAYIEKILLHLNGTSSSKAIKAEMTNTTHNTYPLNNILYGPPGTGKTFNTINQALKIIDSVFYEENKADRQKLTKRFRELMINDWDSDKGQIAFCTFHQSMGYEDFVEGIKPLEPKENDKFVSYKIIDGIFKKICTLASQQKSSSGFEDSYQKFVNDVMEANNSLELKTPAQGKPFDARINSNSNVVAIPKTETASEMVVTKEMIRDYLLEGKIRDWKPYTVAISTYIKSKYPFSVENVDNTQKPFVLIIDEINRGNISQIFGELITLIEEDKRQGGKEEISVTLPYSKKSFSVPSNVYIIGTMNTADRSVEALDTALRRRFVFEEMPPKSKLLSPGNLLLNLWWAYPKPDWKEEPYVSAERALYDLLGLENDIDDKEKDRQWENVRKEPDREKQLTYLEGFTFKGLNLQSLLDIINKRIEKLLSRDHLIGHSYFIHVTSLGELKMAFHNKILPLLQEYFYGDYGKIGLVLGKGFFKDLADEEEEEVFADFDNEDAGLIDKPVYRLKNILKLTDDEFRSALNTLMANAKKETA